MPGYLDDLQERFFTWCDKVVQDYIDREKAEFKQWWPRKSPDGSYELVFKLDARDKGISTRSVLIPDEFHELLEREYFIDHPPDKEEPTADV
jgi:hypothetical protein